MPVSIDVKAPATVLMRALGYDSESILEMFYETTTFQLNDENLATMTLVPKRLQGDMAAFDIMAGDKVLVRPARSTNHCAPHSTA